MLIATGFNHGHPAHQLNAGGFHCRSQFVRAVGEQVGNGDHIHACSLQRQRRLEASLAGCRDDCVLAGLQRVKRRQLQRAGRQHHAGKVVVREYERLLDRTRCRDVALGADLMERAALPDRHHAVEVTERGRATHDFDACVLRLLSELARLLVLALPEQLTARLNVLIDEHDVGALAGGCDRGAEAGDAAADYEHVAVTAPIVGAPFTVGLALLHNAKARCVAQHLLVERPSAARPDEGLVIEASRHEGATEDVGGAHHVEVERRPGVLVLDLHSVLRALGGGSDAGPFAVLDERVRRPAGGADDSTWAVVLE